MSMGDGGPGEAVDAEQGLMLAVTGSVVVSQPGCRKASCFRVDEANGHALLQGKTLTGFVLWCSLYDAAIQDPTLYRNDAIARVNLAMETFEFVAPDFVYADTERRGLLQDKVSQLRHGGEGVLTQLRYWPDDFFS